MLVDCKYQFWGWGGICFVLYLIFPPNIFPLPSSPQSPVLTVSGTRAEFLAPRVFVWREDEDVLIPVVLRRGSWGAVALLSWVGVWEGAVCTVYRYSLASKPLAGSPTGGTQHSHKLNTEACFLCCVE